MGRMRIWAWMAVLLLAAGCSPAGPAQSSEKPVIKLAVSPWVASELNATVARIILEEQMGYTVETVPLDEQEQWAALASGVVHASLEIWPSGHGENIRRYIEEDGTVEDAGLLGPVGKIAWYIPSYLLRARPELSTWQGLQRAENVALFAGSSSEGKGQLLTGDPSWVQHEEEIIRNLGLDLVVVRLGSEEALLAALDAAYKEQKPIMLYFWTPHWAHTIYDLVPIELPAYSDACYARQAEGGVDCDYPADLLLKVCWSGLEDYAPEAYQLIGNLSYGNLDQIAMLASVQLDNMTVEEAARAWMANNPEVWNAWLPSDG